MALHPGDSAEWSLPKEERNHLFPPLKGPAKAVTCSSLLLIYFVFLKNTDQLSLKTRIDAFTGF
jgi:hypothetical protein